MKDLFSYNSAVLLILQPRLTFVNAVPKENNVLRVVNPKIFNTFVIHTWDNWFFCINIFDSR